MTRLSTQYSRPRFSHRILLSLGFMILFISACQPTTFVITATSPSSTETSVPPAAITSVRVTATTSASCTVLQDLNLRNGPGKAYDPPIGILVAGTKFVPIGFEPQGIPGGPWVQAQVEVSISSKIGWVSAGSQFVTCNLELATLPAVEVPPPPPACLDCSSNPNGCGYYDPCNCQCISPP